MKKQTIKQYLFNTIFLSWVMWLIAAWLTNYFNIPFSNPGIMMLFVLGGISPAIIEIYLMKKTATNTEYRAFMKNIFNFKQPLSTYIISLGLSWLFCFFPVLLGGSTQKAPIYIGLLVMPIMVIGGGLEEIGWRGFLQPMLQKKYSNFSSAIIVSLIWTFWHLPLWLIKGSNQSSMNFIWFTMSCVSLSVLLSLIWNKYHSIFMCIIFHASINSFWEVYVPNNKVMPTFILIIICVLLFYFTNTDKLREIGHIK